MHRVRTFTRRPFIHHPAKANVTLYLPGQQPIAKSAKDFTVAEGTHFGQVLPQAAEVLGCSPSLVDVLACGLNYIVYTTFDSEDQANPIATQAVADLTGIDFNVTDEDRW